MLYIFISRQRKQVSFFKILVLVDRRMRIRIRTNNYRPRSGSRRPKNIGSGTQLLRLYRCNRLLADDQPRFSPFYYLLLDKNDTVDSKVKQCFLNTDLDTYIFLHPQGRFIHPYQVKNKIQSKNSKTDAKFVEKPPALYRAPHVVSTHAYPSKTS